MSIGGMKRLVAYEGIASDYAEIPAFSKKKRRQCADSIIQKNDYKNKRKEMSKAIRNAQAGKNSAEPWKPTHGESPIKSLQSNLAEHEQALRQEEERA